MSDSDLEGRCFVQEDCIGLASYHFVSGTQAYICYNAAPCSWLLDDGATPPAQKYFDNAAYDPRTRTFTGKIVWSPVSFGGCARWDYVIVFGANFGEITGWSLCSLRTARYTSKDTNKSLPIKTKKGGSVLAYDKRGVQIDAHFYGACRGHVG